MFSIILTAAAVTANVVVWILRTSHTVPYNEMLTRLGIQGIAQVILPFARILALLDAS